MPLVKAYLKGLQRTSPDIKSRKGYLRLDMNEGVQGLPEYFVREALAEADPAFLSSYPEYKALTEKIAAHTNLEYGNICLSNGSDAAIKYIFDVYISQGDKVLLTAPTFAMYPVYCRMFDAEPVMIEYNRDMSPPTDELLRRVSRDIKMIVVVNPNNPTGSVEKEERLLELIDKSARNDVLAVIDEAYFYFYPETLIERVKEFDNLIVLRTFSKLCSIASARLGYAAACPEIIENLKKVKPTYDVNGFAVSLAEKILDQPFIIKSLIESVNEGKRRLIERLSAEGIEYRAGAANFILIRCYNRGEEIMRRLADARILVNGGFGQPFLKEYIRVTIADEAAMDKFLENFIRIWKERND